MYKTSSRVHIPCSYAFVRWFISYTIQCMCGSSSSVHAEGVSLTWKGWGRRGTGRNGSGRCLWLGWRCCNGLSSTTFCSSWRLLSGRGFSSSRLSSGRGVYFTELWPCSDLFTVGYKQLFDYPRHWWRNRDGCLCVRVKVLSYNIILWWFSLYMYSSMSTIVSELHVL